MQIKCSLLLFGIFTTITNVFATNFTECDGVPKPLGLRVIGCEQPPCKFIRNKTTIFEVDFEAHRDIIELKPQVKAKAMGIETDYPISRTDACLDIINGECPLDKGEEVTYRLQMPILSTFPKVSFQVEFSLISPDENVVCLKINGEVTDE
ncbi:hypothetical protein O3M35_003909 [Rhynocoris fuscipes]|uniref:MD-2-related lipid-recognition domain-containing protein n=1 Tax=Rhynocoris fuscipes TaxID=488301 RepID=A0AAW1CK09_9HEMI